MCLVLTVRRPGELRLGANRDERLDRLWTSPGLLLHDPPVLGGRDLVGGGSWLAVNLAAAFVVAVTNARLGAPRGERSRGQLLVDAASQRSLADAVALLDELDLAMYGPFNLLLADVGAAFLSTNLPRPAVRRVDEALIAIGNDALDDPGPRTRIAACAATGLADLASDPLDEAMVSLLSDHAGRDPFCRHGAGYGTVCSTLLRLEPSRVASFAFAPGPPCRTPFHAVDLGWPGSPAAL